jgi:hypothetical protein
MRHKLRLAAPRVVVCNYSIPRMLAPASLASASVSGVALAMSMTRRTYSHEPNRSAPAATSPLTLP